MAAIFLARLEEHKEKFLQIPAIYHQKGLITFLDFIKMNKKIRLEDIIDNLSKEHARISN